MFDNPYICPPDLPKPFFTWDFDKDLGSWANDANNWNQKWVVEQLPNGGGAACLLGKSTAPVIEEDNLEPWAAEESPNRQVESADIKALLWSRKIPSTVGMKCLALTYKLTPVEGITLALLQRQEG